METHSKGVDMSIGATLLTGVIAALAGGIGVVAGALVTNRGQDRHWLRNQQLAAYRDLLGHYANYSMMLTRAHADRKRWDYETYSKVLVVHLKEMQAADCAEGIVVGAERAPVIGVHDAPDLEVGDCPFDGSP